MKGRLVLAALAAACLTAFAPAPLAKVERWRGPKLDLAAIQGVWAAVSIEEMRDGRLHKLGWSVRRVYVRKNVWGFDTDGRGMYVTVNPSRNPPTIDFRSSPSDDVTAITGVIRLQGDRLQILYVFTQPETRPTNFDELRNHDRLMTLRLVSR